MPASAEPRSPAAEVNKVNGVGPLTMAEAKKGSRPDLWRLAGGCRDNHTRMNAGLVGWEQLFLGLRSLCRARAGAHLIRVAAYAW
jgi:hypothetical protein